MQKIIELAASVNWEAVAVAVSSVALMVSLFVFFSERRFARIQNKPDCRLKVTSIGKGTGFTIRLENVGTGIMVVDHLVYELLDEKKLTIDGNPHKARSTLSRNNMEIVEKDLAAKLEKAVDGELRERHFNHASKLNPANQFGLNFKPLPGTYLYLSDMFTDFNCKMRAEAKLLDDHLVASSNHYLFSIKFYDSESLWRAWERVRRVKVTVYYHTLYDEHSWFRKKVGKVYVMESNFTRDYHSFLAAMRQDTPREPLGFIKDEKD